MGQGLSRTPVRRLPVIVQRIEQRNDRLEAWDMAAPASWLPCPRSSPGIAVQRCWAHKIRNVLDKVKKADQPAVKRALHKIMNAPNAPAARAAARKFANRFEDKYPAAVACLRNDLDELLTCFRYNRKTNAARCELQMQSNDDSAKYDDGPGPWEPSRTGHPWTVSYSPSSSMKTNHRASVPLSC